MMMMMIIIMIILVIIIIINLSSVYNILSRMYGVDMDGVLDWILDLLTTCRSKYK
jgi:hypothetical protein